MLCGASTIKKKLPLIETIESVALIQLKPIPLKFLPRKHINEESKLLCEWQIQQSNFQILHLVNSEEYDKVYNKLPLSAITNWDQIFDSEIIYLKRKPKIIFEMNIPNIEINITIRSCGNDRAQRNKIKKNDRVSIKNFLEIRIPSLQITSVFGKNFVINFIKLFKEN